MSASAPQPITAVATVQPSAIAAHRLTARAPTLQCSPAMLRAWQARQEATGIPWSEWHRQQLNAPTTLHDYPEAQLIAELVTRGYQVRKMK